MYLDLHQLLNVFVQGLPSAINIRQEDDEWEQSSSYAAMKRWNNYVMMPKCVDLFVMPVPKFFQTHLQRIKFNIVQNKG